MFACMCDCVRKRVHVCACVRVYANVCVCLCSHVCVSLAYGPQAVRGQEDAHKIRRGSRGLAGGGVQQGLQHASLLSPSHCQPQRDTEARPSKLQLPKGLCFVKANGTHNCQTWSGLGP